jgi:hypothetical protein
MSPLSGTSESPVSNLPHEMMFKIRQDLNFQQNPKHPGHISRILQGHQILNLTEDHHPLDPVLWASIIEDSKMSGEFGIQGWVS